LGGNNDRGYLKPGVWPGTRQPRPKKASGDRGWVAGGESLFPKRKVVSRGVKFKKRKG
jgi:hypothetical protein